MNPLNSVDHSKKYSSGFNSLLTLQDSEGDILHDSNGVLVLVEGAVEVVINGVVEFWRSFWTICKRGGR